MQCASSTTSNEMRPPIGTKTSVRKCSFASRSGEMSRISTSFRANAASTACHSSRFSELMVAARMRMRIAAAIWFRISASSGEIKIAGPIACSRSNFDAMK